MASSPLSSHCRLLIYGGFRDDVHSVGRCGDLPPRLHDQLPIPGDISTVIGSAGGLVCVDDSTNALFIWNPTSNDVRKIPTDPDGGDNGKKSISFMGFCFEVSLDDYVICKVVPRWGCMHTVEFFGLRDGSWKEVGTYNLPFRLLDDGSSPVTLNGCIHWIVVHYGRSEYSNYGIVAFDLEIMEFVEISFPDVLSPKEKVIRVGIYNGCLCLISYDEDYCEDGEIWVMRRYGRVESWKKEFSVSICLGIVQPFTSTGCGWGEDRKLLLKNCYGDLVLYDPKKDIIVDVLFNGDEFDDGDNDEYSGSCYQVASYFESQASMDALVNREGKRKSEDEKEHRMVRRRIDSD